MTRHLATDPLFGCGRVPKLVSLSPVCEDTQTLSRIVLALGTTIGGLMGLVTYWIG
jgi:hypothetical protein